MSKTSLPAFFLALILLSVTSVAAGAESKFKFTGDSLSWDTPNNQMKYIGNAQFVYEDLLIKGDLLTATSNESGSEESVEVTGSPAQLKEHNKELNNRIDLDAASIHYEFGKKQIKAQKDIHLKQVSESNEIIDIFGDELFIDQQNANRISVSGTPLKVAIIQADKKKISANANSLNYDKQKDEFVLQGNVVLTSERETMKADKVIYNLKSGILQVPKSGNRQVEIIQSKNNN